MTVKQSNDISNSASGVPADRSAVNIAAETADYAPPGSEAPPFLARRADRQPVLARKFPPGLLAAVAVGAIGLLLFAAAATRDGGSADEVVDDDTATEPSESESLTSEVDTGSDAGEVAATGNGERASGTFGASTDDADDDRHPIGSQT